MIEPIMYLGLGFLVASLLALVTIPLVHARAVRLTMRRLEAATPLSMAEIQADKDQLRAEFAMSTRRLEMSVEQLKGKTTTQLAELGKKTDAMNRLKIELGEKTATIFALDARDKALKDQLEATEDELSAKNNTLREAERALADKEAKLANLASDIDQHGTLANTQQIEIVALKTQVESLKNRIFELEQDVKETEARLARERIDAETSTKELAQERGEVERLGQRVALLERELAAQTAEAEILARRVADLELRLADQSKLLAERERERDQVRMDLESGRRTEAELRRGLSTIESRYAEATEASRSEKAQLTTQLESIREDRERLQREAAAMKREVEAAEVLKAEKAQVDAQLERAREDRTKLQREVAAMKREAEAAWAAERVENALLRERINDVAAEVARLTSVLEGPTSQIETILARDTALQQGNGLSKPVVSAPPLGGSDDPKGSLADRIRALQARASRLTSA